MKFLLDALTETQARSICAWEYPPPYDLYQFASWEHMEQTRSEFADPSLRASQYAAVLNEDGALCGFAQFFPLAGWIRIGLGMRPDLCGQGLGTSFVQTVAAEAARRADGRQIDLEVPAWNARARKVYERCGFAYEQTYLRDTPKGPAAFHCMVYRGTRP